MYNIKWLSTTHQTYYRSVIEIFKDGLLYLHSMLLTVIERDDKMKEVTLSHVIRWLLFELS